MIIIYGSRRQGGPGEALKNRSASCRKGRAYGGKHWQAVLSGSIPATPLILSSQEPT